MWLQKSFRPAYVGSQPYLRLSSARGGEIGSGKEGSRWGVGCQYGLNVARGSGGIFGFSGS